MLEFCNCGAQLAPDSLFCHKCGKPQREVMEAEAEIVPEVVVEAPIVAPAPAPLNFHNPIAVRVAFTVALVATLLSWIPVLNAVLWVAAGFFAVYLYRRRTGVFLNVRAGVRMGWITGVLMFVIFTVMFTLGVIPVVANGGIATLLREQFKNASDPNVQQLIPMLETAPGVATFLIFALFMAFCCITLLAMAGGALGAKLVGSKH